MYGVKLDNRPFVWLLQCCHLAFRLQSACNADVLPRGLMGVGVRKDSVAYFLL